MNTFEFKTIKSLVQLILEQTLEHPGKAEWSLQGFGMLRLYVPNGGLINIWDSRYRVPNVSMIHTHPWHFESLVVSGSLKNQRYDSTTDTLDRQTHSCAIIKPGIGGGIMNAKPCVQLWPKLPEFYAAGETYRQSADEIHLSDPADGTITYNVRERVAADEATVFWPYGEEWVDAIPRIAAQIEVSDIVKCALVNLK